MKSNNFNTSLKRNSKTELTPDQKTIHCVLAAAKKKALNGCKIVIARYDWLKRNKYSYPLDMELPNLYLVIKHGNLIRAEFDNVLTHVIKKQNYHIQILN